MSFWVGFAERFNEVQDQKKAERLTKEQWDLENQRILEEREHLDRIRAEDRRDRARELAESRRHDLSLASSNQGFQRSLQEDSQSFSASENQLAREEAVRARQDELMRQRMEAFGPLQEVRQEREAIAETLQNSVNYLVLERGLPEAQASRIIQAGPEAVIQAQELAAENPNWTPDQITEYLGIAGGDPEISVEDAIDNATGLDRISGYDWDDPDSLMEDETFYGMTQALSSPGGTPSAIFEPQAPDNRQVSSEDLQIWKLQDEILSTAVVGAANEYIDSVDSTAQPDDQRAVEYTEIVKLRDEAMGGNQMAARRLAEYFPEETFGVIQDNLENEFTADVWSNFTSNPHWAPWIAQQSREGSEEPEETSEPQISPDAPQFDSVEDVRSSPEFAGTLEDFEVNVGGTPTVIRRNFATLEDFQSYIEENPGILRPGDRVMLGTKSAVVE